MRCCCCPPLDFCGKLTWLMWPCGDYWQWRGGEDSPFSGSMCHYIRRTPVGKCHCTADSPWPPGLFCVEWNRLAFGYTVPTNGIQFSCSVVSDSLQPHGLQHTRPPCPSPTPGAYSNSCPLSRWCHPTISSSVVLFSSCLQSFRASASFPVSQFFASGGPSIGVSASASVLPKNIQDLFPLGWTSWISLQSKGLSRVFSNTTVQKHQFFGAQLCSPTLTSVHDYWK